MGDLRHLPKPTPGSPAAMLGDEFGTILDNAVIDAYQAWLDDRAAIRREMIAEREAGRVELRRRLWTALGVIIALAPLVWVGLR